ncbi:hypothetical protein QQS21_000529 [Conoideocrella luteorostrata]|uniref:Heterokaryon incompatibility domain-containing protein n=1 Tax=Conoideocrella luteorostrata TaxID=1105319 RepID=A0AAJ0CYP9_9HYPO|nr:hypothetical protein QQS21_000529 [Conoideocrella luteorostrata]
MEEPHLEELVDELTIVSATKGHLLYSHMTGVIGDASQKDRPSLSDEVKEMIQVWRTDPNVEPEDSDTIDKRAAPRDSGASRDTFVSHLYINNRWGLYHDTKGKIEEWWISDPPVLREEENKWKWKSERTSIHFEQLHTVFERENCAFCGLLARQIRADHDINKVNPEHLKLGDFYLEILDEGPETGLMLEVLYNLDILHAEQSRFIIHWVDFASEPGKMTPFNGFAVLPASVSFDACNGWLQMCDKCHPTLKYDTKSKESKLRLIDVQENCISMVELPCRYVCLSYVWGGVEQATLNYKTKPILEKKNGLRSNSIKLSKTITDAIVATRKLKMRYLWIDALCIQQDDAQDLSSNIANMDAIYGNAALTIVASTNSNPTQGLPGVSNIPRSKEANYAVVQGMILAVAMHDYRNPLIELNESLWNTRAWTFQERYLSQRLVIFSDSEVMFVCPHSVMFEDTQPTVEPHFESREVKATIDNVCSEHEIWFDIWKDSTQTAPVKIFRSPDGQTRMLSNKSSDPETFDFSQISAPTYSYKQVNIKRAAGFEQFEGLSLWETYRRCAYEYSRRQMSSDEDSVAAFTGLSNRIVRGVNAKFWFNIPSFAFARGLLWYPKQPLRRKVDLDGNPMFPSWSWAAWKGHCHYRGRGWYNALYTGPVTTVKWLAEANREEFAQKHIDKHEPDMLQAALDGKLDLVETIDFGKLYHMDYREKGWKALVEKEKNQTVYVHNKYPGVILDYPIPMPDEELPNLVQKDDTLRFLAFSASVRFCNMSQSRFVQEPGREPYLQVGLNDESASANERPPWQRIIYHQGYRAGYLMLNVPFDEIDESAICYKLVAISRDALSSIAPPKDPTIYFTLGPVEFQYHLGIKETFERDVTANIPLPDKEVTPATGPVGENGDAWWDTRRFQDSIFPLYNVLLVRDIGKHVERIGVGKMHWHALHHAGAKEEVVSIK